MNITAREKKNHAGAIGSCLSRNIHLCQELVLFVPFGLEENGDMQNLMQETDDQIVLLYEKYSQHIKEVKRQVLPFLEDVMEERLIVHWVQ